MGVVAVLVAGVLSFVVSVFVVAYAVYGVGAVVALGERVAGVVAVFAVVSVLAGLF